MAIYTANLGTTAGWTERWATTEGAISSAGGVLTITKSSEANEYGISLDAVDADANRNEAEVLVKLRFNAQAAAGRTVGVFAWGSGASGSETYTYCGLYDAGNDGADFRPYLLSYDNGTPDFLQGADASNSAGTWYWLRAKFSAATGYVYGRAWVHGAAEPTTWSVQRPSGIVEAPGWVGISAKDTATDAYEIGYFAVGTNGDSPGDVPTNNFFMGADF